MEYNKLVIGILGGMGPYATVDFYKRLVDAFPTEKDWQKPRILIDSYSSIPSRVRAILYNEKREELLFCMTNSIRHLIEAGANRIIIACNTAHVFLPEIMRRIPECEKYIINIIQMSAVDCKRKGKKIVKLWATEGTVQTNVYADIFQTQGIEVVNPDAAQLVTMRELIEAVKQNHITQESLLKFQKMMKDEKYPVILGCSELPVLFGECLRKDVLITNEVNDPLQSSIDYMLESFR